LNERGAHSDLPEHGEGVTDVNQPSRDGHGAGFSDSQSGVVLARRVVLQGLATVLLAGCASVPSKPSAAAAKTSSAAKSARQTAGKVPSTNTAAAAKSTSPRTDSVPKTPEEFIAQQPVSTPFNR
jgi:hypothetical protein